MLEILNFILKSISSKPKILGFIKIFGSNIKINKELTNSVVYSYFISILPFNDFVSMASPSSAWQHRFIIVLSQAGASDYLD